MGGRALACSARRSSPRWFVHERGAVPAHGPRGYIHALAVLGRSFRARRCAGRAADAWGSGAV